MHNYILACTFGLLLAGNLSVSGVETNLVAHWTFDDGEGERVADRTQTMGDLILYGNPKWVKNISGYCLQFDATPENKPYAASQPGRSAGRDAGLRHNGTIMLWAHPEGNGCVYNECWLVAMQLVFIGIDTENRWTAMAYDRKHRYVRGAPVEPRWTFLAVTWNAAFLRFYIDGQEVKIPGGPMLKSELGALDIRGSLLYLGTINPRFTLEKRYKGYVDEMKIYNRALTEKEIKRIYEEEQSARNIMLKETANEF